jgi:hypothetical protein
MDELSRQLSMLRLERYLSKNWCVINCILSQTEDIIEISFNSKTLWLKEAITFAVNPGSSHLRYIFELFFNLINNPVSQSPYTIIVENKQQQEVLVPLLVRFGPREWFYVINIQDLGLQSIPASVCASSTRCYNHSSRFNKNNKLRCAQANVKYMMSFLKTF